jgi:hypothetical protein
LNNDDRAAYSEREEGRAGAMAQGEEGNGMNTEQLQKNVGQLFRLRPNPVAVQGYLSEVSALSSDGPKLKKQVVDTDYDWRLESVTGEGVTLFCLHTRHRITLKADNVREYRSPNFLMLRCRLTLEGDTVSIEPS